ncbi:MAG: 2-oxo acid dehydrogenase subunit E2 [Thermomicrobiales bacterium]
MATWVEEAGTASSSDLPDAADPQVPDPEITVPAGPPGNKRGRWRRPHSPTGGATGSIVPFPPLQQMATDWMEIERHRHIMHGLFEVDVTEARKAIRAYRARTGSPLSLTAFLIACLARAVDADKAMQAYRLGRRRQVQFDAVDVGIMVEHEVDGARIPVGAVIREANRKGLAQIQQEIRAAQDGDPGDVAMHTPPGWLRPLLARGLAAWLALPAWLRRAVWAWALRDPYRRKRIAGTVGLTSVGTFGRGIGWGIAPMNHTTTLVVGGLARKPGLIDGRIEAREFLCLTLTLDHDIIDGAPAARFVRRLTELIESGAGLQDTGEERVPVVAP